jgi:hypothetical protein
MKILQETFTYDLYMRNQGRFHLWAKSMVTHAYTMAVALVIVVVVAITGINMLDNRSEISEYDYDKITDNIEYYEEVPEYRRLAKKAMADGVVIEMEFDELQDLLNVHWKERERLSLIKSKAELTDIVK